MAETPSTPQTIKIAPASLWDLRAVHELERLCFPENAWPLREIARSLCLPWFRRWKAQDGNRLVGFVFADLRRLQIQNMAWVDDLAVHPDYRRQGLASRLMDRLESEMSTPRIQLVVQASNRGAIGLYQARGYEQVEVWPKYYRMGDDGVVMEKVLKAQ